MTRFLTADLHLSHDEIRTYSNRPYRSVKEMDKALVDNWNSIVNPDDEVYILGDFTMKGAEYKPWFRRTLKSLKGIKILILGNHDSMRAMDYVEVGFQSAHTSLVVDGIFLAHDPSWAIALPKDMSMFCGHVHELFLKLTDTRKVLNVGVDVWNYSPVEFSVARKELLGD